jgi:ribosomal protein S18 acetylase RimI-like enzyme
MPEVRIVPITHLSHDLMSAIMNEEKESWMAELGWDYAAVCRILLSFIDQKFLPGYAATDGGRALGYTYFLIHQAKGIIGAVYPSGKGCPQELAEELLSLAIGSLKNTTGVRRIEAQIMPCSSYDFTAAFTRHGFRCFPRYFLNLNLAAFEAGIQERKFDRIAHWNSAYLQSAADVLLKSYENQIDALICEDYCTISGCESYLRSLAENPGCGTLLPEATFVGLDSGARPWGIVVSSQISSSVAMIPQIAVHPSCQGQGLGRTLVHKAFTKLEALGYQTVTLTVSEDNRRAFKWYQHLGFKIHRRFCAYTWERG